MTAALKVIWVLAIAVNSIALLVFYLGATAFRSRAPGTDWGFYLFVVGSFMVILIIISIVCLIFGWLPRGEISQAVMIGVIIFITCLNIFLAPLPFEEDGWTTERVHTLMRSGGDGEILVHTTEDGKYEYFLELVNPSQRNSRARLFVRDMATSEEIRIPLDFKNERLRARLASTLNEENAWAYLVPSETSPFIYVLTTTWFLNDYIESFEICMETKTSRRLE